MKPELSVLMAGFRMEMWSKVYASILNATSRNFELVIVSPHETLPEGLRQYSNVKHYRDFGSVSRAAQLCGILAEGKVLFTLMADDGVFLPNSLDMGLDELYAMGDSIKNIVVGKYLEGQAGSEKIHQPNEYYLLNYHEATRTNIPDTFCGLNNGLIYREYFEQTGGYKSVEFEVAPLMLADWAIRAQADGANFKFLDLLFADFNWIPGDAEGHSEVAHAQVDSDEKVYKKMYKKGYRQIPIKIDQNSWKQAPSKWARRYETNKSFSLLKIVKGFIKTHL